MKFKKTHYTVLGMLSIKPMSGYDIKKMVEQSISYFWNESFGQIYPVLKQLNENGYIDVKQLSQQGKPDKKLYFINNKGEKILKQWLEKPAEQDYLKSEFLMKIFFAKHVSKEKTIEQINNYKTAALKELGEYSEIEREIKSHIDAGMIEAENWLLTLEMGKKLCQAKIEWCEFAVKSIKQR
jgi:DNA-binding PadR family transcriptional regulator